MQESRSAYSARVSRFTYSTSRVSRSANSARVSRSAYSTSRVSRSAYSLLIPVPLHTRKHAVAGGGGGGGGDTFHFTSMVRGKVLCDWTVTSPHLLVHHSVNLSARHPPLFATRHCSPPATGRCGVLSGVGQ